MPAAALSDLAAVLLASVPVGLLLIAVVSLGISVANERKRTQPIVIAHEAEAPGFAGSRVAWTALAYLTSDGGGAAFNVRFGIELNGVRHPFRMKLEDPSSGNRQRVVRKDGRVPVEGSFAILITSLEMWGAAARAGDPHSGRLYWARYENAQGKTWETKNPADRSADLDISRVWFVQLWEWREARTRRKAAKESVEWEKSALEELREIRRSAEAGETEQGNAAD